MNLGFKILYKSTYNITEALRPGNPKISKEELHNLFKKLDKDYNIVINGVSVGVTNAISSVKSNTSFGNKCCDLRISFAIV